MKRLLMTFCFLNIVVCMCAQGGRFKNERRVYLWDVTLSMKGFDGAPDIWEKVIKDIETDINSIDDDQTELIVLPFQEGILETWREKATPQGKSRLIEKIENFSNEKITRTNLCSPLRDAISKYLNPDKRNVLYFFTDGNHNMKSPTKEEFYELLSRWCEIAKEKDIFGFYVMLTKNAQDSRLSDIIDHQCRIRKIEGVGAKFIDIYPVEDKVSYNVKSDNGKKVNITLASNLKSDFPNKVTMHIKTGDNRYVKIDKTVTLEHAGKIALDVKQLMSYAEMHKNMPQTMRIPISLTLTTHDKNNVYTTLLDDQIYLELINKPEKTLKVYVK